MYYKIDFVRGTCVEVLSRKDKKEKRKAEREKRIRAEKKALYQKSFDIDLKEYLFSEETRENKCIRKRKSYMANKQRQ